MELRGAVACYVEGECWFEICFAEIARVAGEGNCVVAGNLAGVDLVGVCEGCEEEEGQEGWLYWVEEGMHGFDGVAEMCN